jgi:hypothetical protein
MGTSTSICDTVMSSTGDLLRDLQAAHSTVPVLVATHLADHEHVLPHLLMADITRWLLTEGPQPAVLAVLERHYADGDDEVQNVIALSFLENLLGEEAAVRWALGPRLADELRRLEDWEPDADAPPI